MTSFLKANENENGQMKRGEREEERVIVVIAFDARAIQVESNRKGRRNRRQRRGAAGGEGMVLYVSDVSTNNKTRRGERHCPMVE
jgi:hypothetical protein